MTSEGVKRFVIDAVLARVGSNFEAFLKSRSTLDYFFCHSGFEWVRNLYFKKKKLSIFKKRISRFVNLINAFN